MRVMRSKRAMYVEKSEIRGLRIRSTSVVKPDGIKLGRVK